MRCLAVADRLRAQGGEATFVSRPLSHAYRELLATRKHSVLEIEGVADTDPRPSRSALSHAAWLPWSEEEDAERCTLLLADRHFDWLVVDHYALAADWERAMRRAAHRVMVIDDLADRDHYCDLLLDQNFGRMASHYEQRVSTFTRLLIGPLYALLRPEFAEQRAASLSRREAVKAPNLLISLGAVDKNNHTASVLRSLAGVGLPHDTTIVVVLGAEAPHIASVQAEAARSPWKTEVHVNVKDMAELMSEATWAIGAAGTSAYERCCLGLPTLTLVIADNQQRGAHALSEAGCTIVVNPQAQFDESISQGISELISYGKRISRRCAAITDGDGVLRLINEMQSILKTPTLV
jgi:UDP-2,4-diacetamido-2,4,6-trideoxy-beta-L-altropyranose hydrolase